MPSLTRTSMLAPLSSSRDIIGMLPFKVLMCRQAKPGMGRQERETQSAWTTPRQANPGPAPALLSSRIPAYTTHGLLPQPGHRLCTRLPPGLTLPVLELQVLVVPMGLGRVLRQGCAPQQLLGTPQVLLLTGQVQRSVSIAVLQPRVDSLVDQRLDHAGLLQVHGKVERGLERRWGHKLGKGGMPCRTPSVMSHVSLQEPAQWHRQAAVQEPMPVPGLSVADTRGCKWLAPPRHLSSRITHGGRSHSPKLSTLSHSSRACSTLRGCLQHPGAS